MQVSDRQVDAFFYGLFMDAEVLRQSGARPANPRPACVREFALRIGQRATLVPSPGARAYGMLFALSHEEIKRLYDQPGLEGYLPEAIMAQVLEGVVIPALCYNLADAPAPHEFNLEYAAQLKGVLAKLGFPAEYIATVK